MIGGMNESIIAACDGASKGNPGPAAWAWVVADAQGRPERWEAYPLGTATNNVAELTALRELLESTDPSVPVEVRMDSQYAMNAVTKWLPGWKRNGWKTSAGKPVANRDLVAGIDALLTGRAVKFVYVPAHQVDGDPLNALADQAASEAAVAQRLYRYRARFAVAEARSRPRDGGAEQERCGEEGGRCGAFRWNHPGPVRRSRCHCGKSYAAQEMIAKNPNGWGHPECRTVSA